MGAPDSGATFSGKELIHALVAGGAKRLDGISSSARLDSELLLAYILKTDRLGLIVKAREQIPAEALAQFDAALERRSKLVPVAQLVGTREFWGLDFDVTPDVLIPRPETELMVSHALTWIDQHREVIDAATSEKKPLRVVDLGTGTGCIAIALEREIRAKKIPVRVFAVDLSAKAIAVALKNAKRLGSSVEFVQGSWFEPFKNAEEKFDIVLTNPPYLTTDEVASAPWLQFEPIEALAAGTHGLDAIRQITEQLSRWLSPVSFFQCEIGGAQGPAALAVFEQAIPQVNAQLIHDGAGLDRFIRLEQRSK